MGRLRPHKASSRAIMPLSELLRQHSITLAALAIVLMAGWCNSMALGVNRMGYHSRWFGSLARAMKQVGQRLYEAKLARRTPAV